MMLVVFEREEDNHRAVLERSDGTTFDVDRAQLPKAARPGDSLDIQGDGKIVLVPEETQKRKDRVQKLMNELWE
ncbi:DUF3006 domain-containing protein [Desulfosporosinus sp. Sb-LF]|uniref:DUF3006 domain-containing protein n=1 Tax=Desulfosporosinus sp. Sb-LF TaxID=2560027 RepID=UPI00107FCB7A|nr:DUF3006 domain-containing protein [Desulfosporosinus sp. Sb-LF]TGE31594.1 DUF3006 domain-containing protein [Desulfosporosinus sp. Sb-LF]